VPPPSPLFPYTTLFRSMDHGARADRIQVSYWDALGNETVRYFAADVAPEDIPEQIDSPTTGLPAGRDRENPPMLPKNEPYKTHRSEEHTSELQSRENLV